MKSINKIILAIIGIPFVLLLALLAGLRRLVSGPYFRGDDVIIHYSQVTWDEVWQRPQQYAWRAAESRSMVYCCPVQLHNLLVLGTRWRPVRRIIDNDRQLIVLSPLIFSGHFKNRVIHEINCWITAFHIRCAVSSATHVHFLSNTPYGLRVIQHCYYPGGHRSPHLARLVFDVIDDFTIFEWSPAFGRHFDDQLMDISDAIIAGTRELADARKDAVFIPCGVDYDLFATPRPEPPSVAALPRPHIGYFGTISERIDLDLVAKLADEFPGGSIIMVGPVHFPLQSLPQRPNLHYLGLQRHADLPAFAQAFDVGLIPFRITPATVKLNPVKTLEYLAAGLPVVATRIPDLERFYSHVVHIADSPEAFVDSVKKILAQPNEARITSGVEIAQTASWNGMVEKINEALFPATNAQDGPVGPSQS